LLILKKIGPVFVLFGPVQYKILLKFPDGPVKYKFHCEEKIVTGVQDKQNIHTLSENIKKLYSESNRKQCMSILYVYMKYLLLDV
jgi:hypothetical protein